MSKPIVTDTKPMKTELVAGDEYYYCACGRSKNQPFCDGSHAGTGITPKKFQPKDTGDAYICMCRQTGNAPYCDGTHAKLPDGVKGTECKCEQSDG